MSTEQARRYIAVAGQDYDTCRALNWAYISIRPFIVARGNDEDEVFEAAETAAGHNDIVVVEY